MEFQLIPVFEAYFAINAYSLASYTDNN